MINWRSLPVYLLFFFLSCQKTTPFASPVAQCPPDLCSFLKNENPSGLFLMCWASSWNPLAYFFFENLSQQSLPPFQIQLDVHNLSEWKKTNPQSSWGNPQETQLERLNWFGNPQMPFCYGLNAKGQVLFHLNPANQKEIPNIIHETLLILPALL